MADFAPDKFIAPEAPHRKLASTGGETWGRTMISQFLVFPGDRVRGDGKHYARDTWRRMVAAGK